jgi:hypothetical protein
MDARSISRIRAVGNILNGASRGDDVDRCGLVGRIFLSGRGIPCWLALARTSVSPHPELIEQRVTEAGGEVLKSADPA